MSNLLTQIQGVQLNSVTFVQDYFQLGFDGPGMSVYNPTCVKLENILVCSGDDQFRNMLCGQIKKIVKKVEIVEKDVLIIDFEDNSQIEISLKDEDFIGPEAVVYHGPKNKIIVFN